MDTAIFKFLANRQGILSKNINLGIIQTFLCAGIHLSSSAVLNAGVKHADN